MIEREDSSDLRQQLEEFLGVLKSHSFAATKDSKSLKRAASHAGTLYELHPGHVYS